MSNTKEQIMDLLKSMEEAINFCINKITDTFDIDNELIELINLVIDAYVTIENSNLKINKTNIIGNEQFADFLVNLVKLCENNDTENLGIELIKNGKNKFYIWKENLISNIRINIIVYGFNKYINLLKSIINFDICDIVAYVDDADTNAGKYFEGIKIISIEDIGKYEYDYFLLLGGDYKLISFKINEGIISDEKIFDFYRYYATNFDYNFHKKYYEFIENPQEYEGIVTGLSYLEVGINTKYLDKKFYNFAVSSQDLFYDLKIMEYALSFKELKENIKYAIIGLAYYSFEYDMSRSSRSIRTNIYYPVFNTMHNYTDSQTSEAIFEKFKNKSKYILHEDFEKNIYYTIKDSTEKYLNDLFNNKFDIGKLTDSDLYEQENSIKREFNKNYPHTVKENIEILKDYLELLKLYNIKPIIVVCPHNNFYRKCISNRIKNEFQSIIKEFKKTYEFQYIDCFESNDFDYSDFYDAGHLNIDGAKKFTKILNNKIRF